MQLISINFLELSRLAVKGTKELHWPYYCKMLLLYEKKYDVDLLFVFVKFLEIT